MSMELLRVTVLSLDGIQCSNNTTTTIGFRSSSFPPESMLVPSSQYCTLFATTNADADDAAKGNLLAVASRSEEMAYGGGGGDDIPSNANGVTNGGVLHWHTNTIDNGSGSSCDEGAADATTNNNNVHSSQRASEDGHNHRIVKDQESTPHLEIRLEDQSTRSLYRLPRLIELRVCVICTSSTDDQNNNGDTSIDDDAFDENDNDSCSEEGMDEHYNHRQYHQPHLLCHGVAHLKLSPSELLLNGTTTTTTATTTDVTDKHINSSSNGPSNILVSSGYGRRGGKVVILPITCTSHDNDSISSSRNDNTMTVKLAQNATLSVRVERVCCHAENYFWQKEQRHYMESDWGGGDNDNGVAPASIIHNDSIVINNAGGGGLGLSGLFRRRATAPTTDLTTTTNTATTTTTFAKSHRKDPMVGKILQFCPPCPPIMDDRDDTNIANASSSRQRQMMREMTPPPSSASSHYLGGECCVRGDRSTTYQSNKAIHRHRGNTHNLKNKPTKSRHGKREEVPPPSQQSRTPRTKQMSSKQASSTTTTQQQQQHQQQQSPSKNKSLSQQISDKFLCGATGVSFSDFGDVLKMAGAAGHHCDEDHVGLYVDDSDSFGSSIATADVMGF